jgi:hypothetical protein
MTKTVVSKVMWVGRATVFLVGLAVILAFVIGLASAALAGTGVGAPFNLGKTNTVDAISRLKGSVDGASLLIDNTSSGSNATALSLHVEPGKAPMRVDSSTQVTNLNADQIDGRDSTTFLPRSTYTKSETTLGTDLGGGRRLWEVFCNSGDKILGGGYFGVDATGTTVTAIGVDDFHQGYQVQWTNNDGTPDQIDVQAYCADF